jgi:hypothetical protein
MSRKDFDFYWQKSCRYSRTNRPNIHDTCWNAAFLCGAWSLLNTAPVRMQDYCYSNLSCQNVFISENFTVDWKLTTSTISFSNIRCKMIASSKDRVEGMLAKGAKICPKSMDEVDSTSSSHISTFSDIALCVHFNGVCENVTIDFRNFLQSHVFSDYF